MSSRRSNNAGGSAYSKDAFQESAKRQVGEVASTAQDAVTSGAWIYPIQGIFYLLSHPRLLQPLVPVILRAVLVSLGVVAAMFFFTYLPQVAVLAFVSGPLAFIGAVPLVLGESYIILMFLMKTFLLGQAETDLFDAVLLAKNHTALVQKGRILSPGAKGGSVTKLGKAIARPLTGKLSTDGIVRYILTLPLNFVPVVGTVFFLGYNGLKAGPGYHARYFQLKGYDKTKRQEAIHKRRGAYTAFGVVAMVLNLVPIVSVFFTLTTAVGAALWASDIERKASPGSAQSGQQDEIEVDLSGAGGAERDGKKEL